MKVILFDFDGVIADTFSFCYEIASSRSAMTPEEYRAKFEGNINVASKKAGPDPKRFNFFARYTPELMACQPNEEMTQVVQALARDHVLIIISSTVSPSIEKYLDAYGLRNGFKEILGNDVETSKVQKIRDVLRRYRIAPSETVFITDTLGDIKEAETCGVRSIAVTWGYHSAETLEKGKPFRIVNRPKEIIEAVREMEKP